MGTCIGLVEDARSAGRRMRFDEGNFRGEADFLFETSPGEPPGPQALIARQAAGWSLPVHFHLQHQFQVVLRGSGTLGSHILQPGSVHYTSPQSGYGPTRAGEEGLDYFTLRVLTEKGAWYLPEARTAMTLGIFKEQKWASLNPAAPARGWQTLLELREDGLAAWACTSQAGESVACPEKDSGGGRFYVVIRGKFSEGTTDLPEESCLYWAPPEAAPHLVTMASNSLLVVVQFPRQARLNEVPAELQVAPSPRGKKVN